jgi:hypothetical protein
MKPFFLVLAFIAVLSVQPGFAQDKQQQALLTSYYDIKNALVSSDAAAAALKAGDFLKAVNGLDLTSFHGAEATAFKTYKEKLSFDARHISESKDLAHQREHFASFSVNFHKLAKSVKLSAQPVYYDYCPMNKTYWLSASKEIQNPYYGKQMLDCGSVTETMK